MSEKVEDQFERFESYPQSGLGIGTSCRAST
jgi:hypothetical protein